jgi:hypothetical protein
MTSPGVSHDADDPRDSASRSILERVGLALVALVMAVIFGGLAAAAWIGGEVFLAAMAGAGAVMTVWAAVANLRRG